MKPEDAERIYREYRNRPDGPVWEWHQLSANSRQAFTEALRTVERETVAMCKRHDSPGHCHECDGAREVYAHPSKGGHRFACRRCDGTGSVSTMDWEAVDAAVKGGSAG